MHYTITLEYASKQYTFLDDFNYEGWDEDRNADYQVTYMYTEGNYGCDCNKSDFLYQYCGVDFKDDPHAERDKDHYEDTAWALPCGDTIKLISIKEGERVVWPESPGKYPPIFVQQASGLYVPSVVFSGKDIDGNAQSETIDISASNTMVYSTKQYSSLNGPEEE